MPTERFLRLPKEKIEAIRIAAAHNLNPGLKFIVITGNSDRSGKGVYESAS